MKKYVAFSFAMLLLLLLVLPGCKDDSSGDKTDYGYAVTQDSGLTISKKNYDAVMLVVGNTANEPSPEISKNIKPLLNNVFFMDDFCDNDGKFTANGFAIISAAGYTEHSLINLDDVELAKMKRGGNETNNKRRSDKNIKALQAQVSKDPGQDGLDFVEAIKEAVHQGEGISSTVDTNKLLIVIGSGLNDTGVLNFASNPALLNKDPEATANAIISAANKNLSETTLEGFDVVFSGLGETVAPQPDLENQGLNSRENLRKIYETLISKIGGNVICLDKSAINSEESVSTTNTVVPTIFDTKTPLYYGKGALKNISNGNGAVIHYTDESISFAPESATFVNTKTAETVVSSLADAIKKNKDSKVSIVGYVAATGANIDVKTSKLSSERANAVKALLIKLGVNPKQITEVKGAGTGHFANEFPKGVGGEWSEAAARLNRVVVVSMKNE